MTNEKIQALASYLGIYPTFIVESSDNKPNFFTEFTDNFEDENHYVVMTKEDFPDEIIVGNPITAIYEHKSYYIFKV